MAEKKVRKVKKPIQNEKAIKKSAPNVQRRAKRSRINFTSVLAVLLVFLAFYFGLSLFFGGLIVYSFYDTAENTEIYSLRVVYDDRVLHKSTAESANNEFGLYVPFSHLAEIGSFGIAGDGDEATFFIIGSDNRIQCTINSSLMIINDNPVRISAPLLYEDGEYLIPIVLLENYVNGLDIVYDDDKMICSIVSDDDRSDIELKLLLPEPLEAGNFRDEDKYYDHGTEE